MEVLLHRSRFHQYISDPTAQSDAIANIKPANYAGQYYPVQLTTKTNNPFSAYWLNGLPNTIDPRAYQIFYMPGNSSDPSFPSGTWEQLPLLQQAL